MKIQFTVPELHEPDGGASSGNDSLDRRYGEPVFDALNEGVAPGGLTNRGDIKMLICYMLKAVGQPVSKAMIGEVVQEEEIANYFEAMNAISELLEIGNLSETTEDGEEILSLTERGSNAVDVVQDDIPKTVRESAVKSLVHFLTRERNARENEVEITRLPDGGYNVTFKLMDRESPMMELTMYVADRDQAEILRNNFVDDPAKVYSAVLAALLGE